MSDDYEKVILRADNTFEVVKPMQEKRHPKSVEKKKEKRQVMSTPTSALLGLASLSRNYRTPTSPLAQAVLGSPASPPRVSLTTLSRAAALPSQPPPNITTAGTSDEPIEID